MQIDKTFGYKQENVDYYDRQGAYLIAIENRMVATVKTPKGNFLLGGGIEDEETHIQCIKRECLEEIGYHVIVDKYVCCAEEYLVHEKLFYFHPVQFYYFGKLVNKVSLPTESDHILEWISISDIENKMYVKAQCWAIKNYFSDIAK